MIRTGLILWQRSGYYFLLSILTLASVVQTVYSASADNSTATEDRTEYKDFVLLRDSIVNHALDHNQKIKAAHSKIDAANAAVKQLSLDPPQIAVEFFSAPVKYFPSIFKDQMEIDYSVQQMFPFPGKLSAMSNAEKKRVEMLSMEKRSAAQDFSLTASKAFNELYLIDRNSELNRAGLDLITTIIAIARKHYENGMEKQTDLLRLQTEYSYLLSDSIAIVQNRLSINAMINSYSSSLADDTIRFIPETELPQEHISTYENQFAIADSSLPELHAMRLNSAMKSAELLASKKEFYPDIMVRGMYKQMIDEPDDWSLMLGLTIPFAPWSIDKYRGSMLKNQALINDSDAEIANMKAMVYGQIRDACAKARRYNDQALFLRNTVIPQAEQTLLAAIASYKSGDGNLLMILDIQKMFLMTKKEYHMTVLNLLNAYSDLERATGTSGSMITLDRK